MLLNVVTYVESLLLIIHIGMVCNFVWNLIYTTWSVGVKFANFVSHKNILSILLFVGKTS